MTSNSASTEDSSVKNDNSTAGSLDNITTGIQTSNTMRLIAQLDFDDLTDGDDESFTKHAGKLWGKLDVIGSAATGSIMNPVSLETKKQWKDGSFSSRLSEEEKEEESKKKKEDVMRDGKKCLKVKKCYGGFLLGGFRKQAVTISEQDVEYLKAIVLAIDNLCGFYE